MGYVAPPPANLSVTGNRSGFSPNLDRFGLPRDYATYLWATYGAGSRIPPDRRAFLYAPTLGGIADFGQQMCVR